MKMSYKLKSNLSAGTWLITMAILVYSFMNESIPKNIWDSNNYLMMTIFTINGISFLFSFYYFLVDSDG